MLSSLTPAQQVRILFAVVFGVLLVASTSLLIQHLRTPLTEATEEKHLLLRRARWLMRSSWWMLSVFWICWALGDFTATVLFALISFLALREFISLTPTHRSDHRSLVVAFFLVVPLQYWFIGTHQTGWFTVFIPVYVFLIIPALSALGNDPHHFLERNAKLQWGIMVCVYGMSHVPALLLLQYPGFEGRSAFLVFSLATSVQVCMLVQHVTVRYFPTQPLAPAISQSFQWKGWLLGMASGIATSGLLSLFTPLNWWHDIIMGAIACLAGTLGHFVMKAIKRDRGVTSWGNAGSSVTGANGLLDKVDALCFAAPVFYHALQWVHPVTIRI